MPGNRPSGHRYHNRNQGGNYKRSPNKNNITNPNPTGSSSPSVKIEPLNAQEKLDHPTEEVKPTAPPPEKKFTQRSRLFVGNIPLDMSEQEFKALFEKYGEISEIFVNSSKGFGFVRLDTRANAEKAKWELDCTQIRNRQIRIRFASHGAAVSIKHLSPYVSNELLENAFSQFGPVERAVVIVDDRGRSTGRGIVEFARKSSATKALQQITDGCFLLTSSPQAVVVKPLEQEDTEDGLSEKAIPRNNQYMQEREAPPRFAQPGTFEYEFALRWKALDEMERDQQDQLTKSMAAARGKLEAEMENAIHEHKTMLMKQDLIRRQEELQRLEEARMREMERKRQLEFAREENHKKELEALAKRQEILRAQIEGNFNHGNPMRGNDDGFGQQGFNKQMQEAMGGGQGMLGPAPPSHSARNCPRTLSNMKKCLGNSKHVRRNARFYECAFGQANKGCSNATTLMNTQTILSTGSC